VSSEQLDATTLAQVWIFTEKTPPQPAWHGTMQRDAWANIAKQKEARAYDKAFNLIAAQGQVFIASSSGNACVALNAADGKEDWRHLVQGAVRIAPTYDNDRVYFGSDDGQAYCVLAATGNRVWSFRGAPDKTLIPADHKFISRYPCRTGVLVQGGKAYCGFGLLPWQDNHLASLNALTGASHYNKTVAAAQWYSMEGPMLASSDRLFVLQGRVSPISFQLSNGNLLGRLPGGGGTFAVLTPDDKLIHGPGHGNNDWAKSRTFHLQESNAITKADLTRHSRAHRVLVNGSTRYYVIREAIQATGGSSWVQTMQEPETLILGGSTLYVGGKNEIRCYHASSGVLLRTLPVHGVVHCLALADGRLFASTHSGRIYAFQ
jgi:outer membrane protein assembly factor BamB